MSIKKYDVVIMRTGAYISLDALAKNKELLNELKKFHIISTVKYAGRQRVVHFAQLYVNTKIGGDKFIKIPRFSAFGLTNKKDQSGEHNTKLLKNKLNVVNELSNGDNIKKDRFKGGIGINPRANQPVILEYLKKNVFSEDNIKSGCAGCTLIMDTGQGKTFIGGKVIEIIKKKTLIVIPKMGSIGTEWFKMLESFPSLIVGRYDGKKKIDGDVIIACINSIYDAKEFIIEKEKVSPNKFFSRFGLIIFDEIHRYGAPKFRKVFWNANSPCMLGLTATPDERQDGFDNVYPMFTGPILDSSKLEGFSNDSGDWKGEIRAIKYFGPPEYTKTKTNKTGQMSTINMCKQFAQDPYRTRMIIGLIVKMYKKGKYIYVFSELRDYIDLIVTLLKEEEVEVFNNAVYQDIIQKKVKKSKVHTLMGGTTMAELLEARKNARIVVTTYSYGIEGVSIVKMNCMVFATPRRNKMKQATGRILRSGSDMNEVRIIYDIIDVGTPLQYQFTTRKKVYDKRGFPIKFYKKKWKRYELACDKEEQIQNEHVSKKPKKIHIYSHNPKKYDPDNDFDAIQIFINGKHKGQINLKDISSKAKIYLADSLEDIDKNKFVYKDSFKN